MDDLDRAYEAFVDDCMREGIDPNTGDAIEWASPEWTQDEDRDPFYGELLEGEPVEF